MDKTIFLCGFMGCGKTTVGKILAEKSGRNFFDLDDLIVESEGRTIPEIFAQNGEEYFRAVESRLITELGGNTVVALGGGAVLRKENTAAAKRSGVIVFIDTDFDTCYSRICGDSNRPLASNADRAELLERFESRYPIYRAAGDIIVSGDGTPEDIADKILVSIS